jgi:hypothetical protein
MQLRVRLTIPDPKPEDAGSRVRATIVDTSQADALHAPVAETSTVLDVPTRDVSLVFDVPDALLQEGRRYSLQAHVDRDGGGDIKPGDLIITENVPVLPRARAISTDLEATLTRI